MSVVGTTVEPVGMSHPADTKVPIGFTLFLGQLLRVDLIKWVSNVRPSVHPSTKSFLYFNEIWYAGRGRRVMHDGMQYDPIHGQGQGHEPL